MSARILSTSVVSLSFCAAARVCSQAAPLSASTQRMTVATSRMSHAGVPEHNCRFSQPMLASCGANSPARAANSKADGLGLAPADFAPYAGPVKRSAAAVASEFASARAPRIAAASALHVWYLFVVAAAGLGCRVAMAGIAAPGVAEPGVTEPGVTAPGGTAPCAPTAEAAGEW